MSARHATRIGETRSPPLRAPTALSSAPCPSPSPPSDTISFSHDCRIALPTRRMLPLALLPPLLSATACFATTNGSSSSSSSSSSSITTTSSSQLLSPPPSSSSFARASPPSAAHRPASLARGHFIDLRFGDALANRSPPCSAPPTTHRCRYATPLCSAFTMRSVLTRRRRTPSRDFSTASLSHATLRRRSSNATSRCARLSPSCTMRARASRTCRVSCTHTLCVCCSDLYSSKFCANARA